MTILMQFTVRYLDPTRAVPSSAEIISIADESPGTNAALE